jgi:hypothetical protein
MNKLIEEADELITRLLHFQLENKYGCRKADRIIKLAWKRLYRRWAK